MLIHDKYKVFYSSVRVKTTARQLSVILHKMIFFSKTIKDFRN